MNTPILTRAVVSIASLAIGSVALAAAPASADTSTGTTRQDVIAMASDARSTFYNGYDITPATQAFAEKVCGFTSAQDASVRVNPSDRSTGVDGLLVRAVVEGSNETPSTTCTFAAFAAAEPFSTMSGTANITVDVPVIGDFRAAAAPSHDYTLAGDVYVTAPVSDIGYDDLAVATASGDVTRTEAARTTTSRVVTPKTTAVKVAARKAYQRTIDKAQAKLARALKKAGSSSSKKAAARKTYAARKKAAKAKLHIAWLGDKKTVVTTVPTSSSTKPFTLRTVISDNRF